MPPLRNVLRLKSYICDGDITLIQLSEIVEADNFLIL